jgi:hypothetical protein
MASREHPYKWGNLNFKWGSAIGSSNNIPYTWDNIQLIQRAAGEDWNTWKKDDKKELIKLILKIHSNTITESKQKEIKQYKIKATDIRLAVKEVLGTQMIAENVSI